MDTIAAIATGAGRTALGVIRLSGDRAVELAERIFRPARGGRLTERPPHRLVLGDVLDDSGLVLDQVLATYALGPRSFTGEDTAELQGHGSPAALTAILRQLFRLGARQAGPGEFTRRAFLNGRMDLTQAEAVMDLIDSDTAAAARNAAAQLHGAVTRKTDKIYDALLGLEAHFQAVVDYPDEGVEPLEAAHLAQGLAEASGTLRQLLSGFSRGLALKEGVPCAILGRPNVGKSSLLNALLGYDRAIVTDRAGTTRDTLEEKLSLGGTLLRLTDTAGLRATEDPAERQGVQRARAAAAAASLVLAVFDGSAPLTEEDLAVMDAALRAPHAIALINKSDLDPLLNPAALTARFPLVLPVSACSGAGLEALADAVGDLLAGSEPVETGELITNARQYDAIFRAEAAVRRAEAALRAGLTPDAVLLDTEDALAALGELSGRTLREDLVDAVFSRFCVGK